MAEYPELPPEDPNKHCASCGAILPTPLSEFGDVKEPVCQKCFLDPEVLTPEEKRYKAELEHDINRYQSDIENYEEEIRELEQQISSLERIIRKDIQNIPDHKEELIALDRWKSAVLA